MPENMKAFKIDLGNWYPTHGSVADLYKQHGLDAESVAKYIQEVLKVEN